jgi:hypothetical protein
MKLGKSNFKGLKKERNYMLGIIAIILLILWAGGLALHLLGAFIYIFLVLAVISGIAHFLTGKKT